MKSCMPKFVTTLCYESSGHHALPFFLVGSIVSLVHILLFVFSWGMTLLKIDIGVVIQSLKHCLHLSSSVLKPGAKSRGEEGLTNGIYVIESLW